MRGMLLPNSWLVLKLAHLPSSSSQLYTRVNTFSQALARIFTRPGISYLYTNSIKAWPTLSFYDLGAQLGFTAKFYITTVIGKALLPYLTMAIKGDIKDTSEEARIAEQNLYISRAFAYTCHPTVVKSIQAKEGKVHIAEVSLGLSRAPGDLPSATWESFSIKEIASSNGVEPHHRQTFDLVAVRLLQPALSGDEFDIAMKNIIFLLKPGGWIQWVDWDPLTVRVAGAKPGTSDQAVRQLLQRYTDALKANGVGTTYKIPNGFRAAGLENEDSDIYPLRPDEKFTSNIARGAVKLLREKDAMEPKALEELFGQVEEEIRTGGPLLWYDLWCHIAQKSS